MHAPGARGGASALCGRLQSVTLRGRDYALADAEGVELAQASVGEAGAGVCGAVCARRMLAVLDTKQGPSRPKPLSQHVATPVRKRTYVVFQVRWRKHAVILVRTIVRSSQANKAAKSKEARQARPALPRSWVAFSSLPPTFERHFLRGQTISANSHCRASLRLPLPPAPRMF